MMHNVGRYIKNSLC